MSEKDLIHEYMQGKINRREFVKLAGMLGMSLTAIGSALAACGTPPRPPR